MISRQASTVDQYIQLPNEETTSPTIRSQFAALEMSAANTLVPLPISAAAGLQRGSVDISQRHLSPTRAQHVVQPPRPMPPAPPETQRRTFRKVNATHLRALQESSLKGALPKRDCTAVNLRVFVDSTT